MRLRWLAPALALAALGCASVPDSHGWIEVRTERFHVMSQLSEPKTLELAERLELFRRLTGVVTDIPPLPDQQPVRAFAFRRNSDFQRYSPREGLAGVYLPQMRGDLIALYGGYREAEQVVYHEYTHRLLHGTSPAIYPMWFDEGFAEVMSSVEVQGDSIVFGRPPTRATQLLRASWLPLDQVVDSSEFLQLSDERQSMFYAESWALVHYMMLGPGQPEFSARMDELVRLESQGHAPGEAFERVFGGIEALDSALRGYVRSAFPLHRVRRESLGSLPEPDVRAVPADEAAESLGVLAMAVGHFEMAESLFRESLAASPERPRALGGLADLHLFRGDWAEAEALFARSIASGADDALAQLDYGQYWHTRSRTAPDEHTRREQLERAREHLVTSRQIDPSLAEAYAAYGASYLEPGQDPTQSLEPLLHANRLLPSNVIILYELGRAYLALGRREESASMLRRVVAWSHDPKLIRHATELLERNGLARTVP